MHLGCLVRNRRKKERELGKAEEYIDEESPTMEGTMVYLLTVCLSTYLPCKPTSESAGSAQ
jgi:hypothetical protein